MCSDPIVAPAIIAHRTCKLDAPENSLEGIRTAARLGADLVEVDVRRTADGVPVLLHDPLLLRTTLRPWPIHKVRAASLRRWHLRGSKEHAPTLAEGLAAMPKGLGMAIDIKDPGAGPAVIAACREQGVLGRVLLWSQHERAVRHCAENTEGVEIALLRDALTPDASEQLLRDAIQFGATAISAHQGVITPDFLDACHGRGLRVHCWFQDQATQRAKAHLGLDGIVTDWPVEARRRVEQAP
jgi:glycerophosphoryl diester phosphodiesterase